MSIGLTDEQRLLQDSVRRFVERDYDDDARRRARESETGFDRDTWARFAELGWLGVALPEAYDGADGGLTDITVLLDGLGRGLVVEPFLSTVVIATNLINEIGSDTQKQELLPTIAAGKQVVALAVGEHEGRYDLHHVATRAEATEDGYRLNGAKCVVYDAPGADTIIVTARTAGETRDEAGITAFLIDPAADGVGVRAYPTIDGRAAADLTLDGMVLPGTSILGRVGEALLAVECAIDRGRVALGAEAAGIMAVMVETTRDYLRTRQQFGTTLNRFQVLQHRLVDMHMAQKMTEALVQRVAAEFDAMEPAERARAAAAVKAQVGRAGRFVGQQSIQLHGGMGMTDELDIGRCFKRLSIIDTMYGDAAYHLRRFRDLKDVSASSLT